MMGYCIGMVMLTIVIIVCFGKGVYDMITDRPDPFLHELYQERLEIIKMLEEEQRLDK